MSYWLLDGGYLMDTQILLTDHAAIEAAYLVSGVIPGEAMTAAEERLFDAALAAAKSNLPRTGQVRWVALGEYTPKAKHVLEQTMRSVQHMLNG
jgi:hypothetical protein